MNVFLTCLSEQGQDITYLTTARKGGAFFVIDHFWGAPCKSSFRECDPGGSTFIFQVVDASWHVEDILHGPMKHATTDKVISNCQRRMKLKFQDDTSAFVFHKPCGANLHQVRRFVEMGCGSHRVVPTTKDFADLLQCNLKPGLLAAWIL